MKTYRTRLLTLVLVLTAAYCGLGLAKEAKAQQVIYSPADPVVYQVHYHRVYQGSTWHWSAVSGWHRQDHYIDVPHWVPNGFVYPQPVSVPIIPNHYSR